MFWKMTLVVVLIAGMSGVVYISGVSKAQLKEALHYIEKSAGAGEMTSNHPSIPVALKEDAPWDGLVTLTEDEEKALGLGIARVMAQDGPIKLELRGRTSYDPDTLTKIRPRFDTLVEKVFAFRGQKVKKGDPLVELHSTDLATAKSDFQSKFVQWQHDLNLYHLRQELVKNGAISKQTWVDTQNDEKKSRLDYNLARDKLKELKVPEDEIEPLLAPLGDSAPASRDYGNVAEKAKMILRSPVDGTVIEREVVPQNFYETQSVLMVIAPLDHLWVEVNVYERDQDKVKVGQTMEINFPFLSETIQGKVQYVANEISKDTHAVTVRASIRNPEGRFKADMLVKAQLDIPPKAGETNIPRQAMISASGSDYVFVRSPREDLPPSAKGHPGGKLPDKFERRRIVVAQENHDFVVVDKGLSPGEEVVTSGSLIVSQLFEDAKTVATGVPSE
ncbi:efflux RND transporter periplasmic adaptor subunit [Singulisphaera sp. PoT]|uniref:efflux RND transporter periplasmic adaptor subunit n=1 Tax=Singulisphaera sp. PoT TaxID=3411797 RepID=UPI003BF4E47F